MSGQSFTTAFSADQTPKEAFRATDTPGVPVVVDRATWQADPDALLVREEAHTRSYGLLDMTEISSALSDCAARLGE